MNYNEPLHKGIFPANKTTFIAIFILVLLSCTSSKLIVNEETKRETAKVKKIKVYIGENVSISYDGDVEPEFGKGNENTLISNFFKEQIKKDILALTVLENCVVSENVPRFRKIKKEFKTLKWAFIFPYTKRDTLILPDDGQEIYVGYDSTDYILFVDDLKIGTTYSSIVAGTNTTTTKELGYSSNVWLWDCREKKVISYGKVSEKVSGVMGFIVKNTWLSLSDKYVSRIFDKTGLIASLQINRPNWSKRM